MVKVPEAEVLGSARIFQYLQHAPFLGPVTVDGDIASKLFGQVVEAAPPRPVQVALKFTF